MRIAVFSCGDENFTQPSIVALKSMEKNLSGVEVDLFYISDKNKNTTKNLKLLNENNIEFLDFTDKNIFFNSQRWPKEAFWYLLGPEYFYDRGYEYSIYIDGDTLTVNNIGVNELLKKCESIMAVKDYFDNKKMIGSGLDKIMKKKTIKKERLEKPHLNSGVLYFNNRYFKNINFIEKLKKEIDFLNEVGAYDGLYADQGLVAYLEAVEIFDIKFIDKNYNFLTHLYQYKLNSKSLENIKTFHFIGAKPWKKPYSYRQRPHSIIIQEMWIKFVKEELGWTKIDEKDLKTLKQNKIIKFIMKMPLDLLWKKIWYIKHKKRGNLLD